MRLTTLGTGTCVVSLERNAPANLIQAAGKNILLDCGSGALKQLLRAGLQPHDLDMVITSHYHPDHFADLLPLLHALNWTPNRKMGKELLLVGPVGFNGFLDMFVWPMDGSRPEGYVLRVVELGKKKDFGGISLESYSTRHNDESMALKFIEKGKSLVISGDTGYEKKFAVFAKDADLLVLECSFEDEHRFELHLTPRDCGLIAKEAGAKKLVLTHLYPPAGKKEVRLLQAKKVFGNVVLAEDMDVFDI